MSNLNCFLAFISEKSGYYLNYTKIGRTSVIPQFTIYLCSVYITIIHIETRSRWQNCVSKWYHIFVCAFPTNKQINGGEQNLKSVCSELPFWWMDPNKHILRNAILFSHLPHHPHCLHFRHCVQEVWIIF